MNIICDMDGILSDFFSSALQKLNKATGKSITREEYVTHNSFDMEKIWGISQVRFWEIIEDTDDYWESLNPFPWAKDLYEYLSVFGKVTIGTTPSPYNETCPAQKIRWLKKHLEIKSTDVMIGSRKYLMANEKTILVDDYHINTEKFTENGGVSCLLRSNWNCLDHSWATVKADLDKVIKP